MIPLTSKMIAALSCYQATQALELGRELEQDDGIFLAPRGARYLPKSVCRFREWLHRAMKRARIAKTDGAGRVMHVHALRHTAATRLLRAGAPMQAVARVLGHSSTQMLDRVYAHLEAEDARAAIRALPSLPTVGSVRHVEAATRVRWAAHGFEK